MIADSSAWLEQLCNTGSDVDLTFKSILRLKQPITIPDVVFQEVTQGARSIDQFNQLCKVLKTFPRFIPHDSQAIHQAAALLYLQCRQQGLTIRKSNDCLIAACAIESGVPLLHKDRDFVHIAMVDKNLKLLSL
jgi:predicted nucleic acid-binding protein